MEQTFHGDSSLNKQTRGSSEVERWTHNPEAGGAIPPPATNTTENENIVLGYN